MATRNISGSRRSNALPLDTRYSWAWLADSLKEHPERASHVPIPKGQDAERLRRSLRNALERRGLAVSTEMNDDKTWIVVRRKAVA